MKRRQVRINNAQNIGLIDVPNYWGPVEEKHMDPICFYMSNRVCIKPKQQHARLESTTKEGRLRIRKHNAVVIENLSTCTP